MTLNIKRPDVPHIHITTTPDSQISLWVTNFHSVLLYRQRISSYLWLVHRIIPKWHWTLKGQRYPIYMLQLPPCQKFHSICSTASLFRVIGQFEISALNDPQMTLTTKGLKVSIYRYMLQLPPSPKNHSVLLYGQPFLSYRSFLHKCTVWLKMTLNSKRSKVPHIHTASVQ